MNRLLLTPEEGRPGGGFYVYEYRASALVFVAVVFSFIGYAIENFFCAFSSGSIDSRHQLLPFLFAYGLAVTVLYFVLGTPDKMRLLGRPVLPGKSAPRVFLRYALYFAALCFFIFFGEMWFGTLCENVAGVVFWDYTGIPLHVTRYTGFLTSFGLAAGMSVMMNFIFAPLAECASRMPRAFLRNFDVLLGGLIFLDFLVMIVNLFAFSSLPDYWTLSLA